MDLSRAAIVLLATTLVAVWSSHAQFTAFEAQIDNAARTANVSTRTIEGVEYIALGTLVQNFGGAFSDLSRRMMVDLAGTRAWVQVNDNRVNALSIFELKQPIRRVDEQMFIARSDVVDFFQQGFRVSVRERAGGAPPPPREPETAPSEPAQPQTTPRASRESADIETLNNETARRSATSGLLTPRPPRDRPIESIIIDAGHGGRDTGAQGRAGTLEKELNLTVALAVWKILSDKLDVTVEVTRGDDLDMSLKERALLAAKHEADLMLSIHVGGSASPDARGAAIFYPPPTTDEKGRYSITAAGAPPPQYYRDIGEQSRDVASSLAAALEADDTIALRGVYEAPIRVLTHADVPGLLIEIGCITNPSEEVLLQDEAVLRRIAARVANGVLSYLGQPTIDLQAVAPAESD